MICCVVFFLVLLSAAGFCADPVLRFDHLPELIPQNEVCRPSTETHSTPFFNPLPDGFIYPEYLAYTNSSRLAGVWNHDEDLGWLWDINLGGRAGLMRLGTLSATSSAFQVDIEGNVHLRLDLNNYGTDVYGKHQTDMDANDFRFGIPFSWGNQLHQIRTGYYHTSSHTGDERMLRLWGSESPPRLNYVREAWILGYSYRPIDWLRLYAEADWAFSTGERTKPWHFLFGTELVKQQAGSSPFAAMHITLLQEKNYDGNITVQTGWQWRGKHNQLFRAGIQYFGGVSEQYEFIDKPREHKIGIGLWYDF